MKPLLTLYAWIGLTNLLIGQNAWHVKLPYAPTFPYTVQLYQQGAHFLVGSLTTLHKLNDCGAAIGYLETSPLVTSFWTERKDPLSGKPYFLFCRIQSNKYTLGRINPGSGPFVHAHAFTDSLYSLAQFRSPVILEANDSTFYIFGKKHARKIVYQAINGVFSERWIKTISFDPTGAVFHGDKIIIAGSSGRIRAYDLSGNLAWEKSIPYKLKGIKKTADGFALNATDSQLAPVLIKLDFDSNLLWTKNLPGKTLADLTITPDGGMALAGQSELLNAFLLKTDPNGNVAWTKEYGPGNVMSLYNNTLGELVLLYSEPTNAVFVMKTTRLGETSPAQPLQVRERSLETPNFKTTQMPGSALFLNEFDSEFHIPADSITTTIYSYNPWLAGFDSLENLIVSASFYGDPGGRDYRNGIATSPEADFKRVWAISRAEISQLRRDYLEDQILDMRPSYDLLTWPAKGNPHFLQNLDFSFVSTNPDSLPAPFVDVNGNGIYNVFEGDYPVMKGDRMLWWAMTDATEHTDSHSPRYFSIDVLNTLYVFDCTENSLTSNTLFYEFQAVNRNTSNFHAMYLGFVTDFQIGCIGDDLVGSLPESNSVFGYNLYAIDGGGNPSFCQYDITGFLENNPVQSITFLNHTLDHAISPWSCGICDNPGTNLPFNLTERYNYLKSIWRDGSHLVEGGSGWNSSDIETDFIFNGNPSDSTFWTMCDYNSQIGNRLMISSHGPFNFASGDTITSRQAFIFHPSIPHPCPDVYSLVKPRIQQIQQWHDDGTLDATLDFGIVQTLQAGQALNLNATIPNASGYQWSNGATTAQISIFQPGEYSVTVSRSTACDLVERVLVKSAYGPNNPALPSWQIQPNPANVLLTIRLDHTELPLTAIVRNALGQVLITSSKTTNLLDIAVTQFPAGVYWVELWNQDQFLGTRKVIISR